MIQDDDNVHILGRTPDESWAEGVLSDLLCYDDSVAPAGFVERDVALIVVAVKAREARLRTGPDHRDWKSIAEGLLLAIETKEELTSVRRRFGLDEKGDVEPSESNPSQPAPVKDEDVKCQCNINVIGETEAVSERIVTWLRSLPAMQAPQALADAIEDGAHLPWVSAPAPAPGERATSQHALAAILRECMEAAGEGPVAMAEALDRIDDIATASIQGLPAPNRSIPSQPESLTFTLLPNEDAQITCIFCRSESVCEHAFVVNRHGERALVGIHSRCVDPLKARNPSQPAPLAKDEAASLPSACGCDARYKCHKHYGQVDADGTASDYDRARALAEQWADVFGADVPERINLTRRVATLLGDVRRETIQACAAWLDAQLKANGAFKGFVDGADMVAAMTKKDGDSDG